MPTSSLPLAARPRKAPPGFRTPLKGCGVVIVIMNMLRTMSMGMMILLFLLLISTVLIIVVVLLLITTGVVGFP